MIIKQPAIVKINNRRKYISCNIETKDDQLISINTVEFVRSNRNIKFLTWKMPIGSKVKFRVVAGSKIYTGVGIISWKTITEVYGQFEFNFEISKFLYFNCKEPKAKKTQINSKSTLDMFREVWYNNMTRELDKQILRGQ